MNKQDNVIGPITHSNWANMRELKGGINWMRKYNANQFKTTIEKNTQAYQQILSTVV